MTLTGGDWSGSVEKMERWSTEHSCCNSREYTAQENVQRSVTMIPRIHEYGNGNGNMPTNCKYTQ